MSHETVRKWCLKFSRQFKDILQKRERKVSDKWHLDEMSLRINGEAFVLWRAVDEQGMELDVFLQKRRNKKAAIRKEKTLIKFKFPKGTQLLLSLMGKVRNLFAVTVNRYKHKAPIRRQNFEAAKSIWDNSALGILHI